MLTGYQTVTPAYGRDYKSAREAREAFKNGNDFILQSFNGSGYVSIADFAPGATANIRYSHLRKVVSVKVTVERGYR